MNRYAKRVGTPAGDVILVATSEAVIALAWSEAHLAGLGLADAAPARACAPLSAAEKQLAEYFRRDRTAFDLPLAPEGTDFQRRVWDLLTLIPYGSTWSYRELARRAGDANAARAVGSANGRNPLSIFIPCHRVVRASGEMGGYAGGLPAKAFLLELERPVSR